MDVAAEAIRSMGGCPMETRNLLKFRSTVARVAIAVSVALVLLLPSPVAAGGDIPLVFNAKKDFRLSPHAANPSGPWSYRQTYSDGSRRLLTHFDSSFSDVEGIEAWSDEEAYLAWPWTPSVGFNNTGGDHLYLPADRLFVHPSNEHAIVIGWKSPSAGRVSIRLWLTDLDTGGGDGVGWSIGKVNHAALKGKLANGGAIDVYVASLDVAAGDRIDLKVHARTDQGWDTTMVGLKISLWPD